MFKETFRRFVGPAGIRIVAAVCQIVGTGIALAVLFAINAMAGFAALAAVLVATGIVLSLGDDG